MRDGLFRQNQFQIKREVGSFSVEVLKVDPMDPPLCFLPTFYFPFQHATICITAKELLVRSY